MMSWGEHVVENTYHVVENIGFTDVAVVHHVWSAKHTCPVKLRPTADHGSKFVTEDRFFLSCNCADRLHQFHISLLWGGQVTNIFVFIDLVLVSKFLLPTRIILWQKSTIPIGNDPMILIAFHFIWQETIYQ